MTAPRRILVIKHSALGDFVLAVAGFQAIRRHHPDAWIVLLTTRPYAELAERSGLFDAVWLDERPGPARPAALLRLIRQLRAARFDRVYDLQRSDRTGWYFRLLGRPKPEWVGKTRGASHRYRHAGSARHIAEREAEQLALAGIEDVGLPDLSFLDADLSAFDLPPRFALLVPGGAAHRPRKRWPAANYAELGRHLAGQGITPLLLGTESEAAENRTIHTACPAARDLTGRTGFPELAALARRAVLAVGNDTGPMHLIAAAGCPSLVLFSAESDPVRISPRGPVVHTLQRDNLADLPVETVVEELPALGG